MTFARPVLGAPGIYRVPSTAPLVLRPEQLDVAGLVGVAPRGPVDVPVAVRGLADYQWRFGGFEGPGLLPHAVRTFFAQGGRDAYVLRVSPLPRLPDPAAVAAHARHRLLVGEVDPVSGWATGAVRPVDLLARDEGSWGNRLLVRWDFVVAQQFITGFSTDPPPTVPHPTVPRPMGACAPGHVVVDLPDGVQLPPCSLLRLSAPGLPDTGVFAWTGGAGLRDGEARRWRAVAAVPVEAGAAAAGALPRSGPVTVEVITITATVTDTDPAVVRTERFEGLGLRTGHPRFVADVLADESLLICSQLVGPQLVGADGGRPEAVLPPDLVLSPAESQPIGGPVTDRWAGIGPESFCGDDVDPYALPVDGPDGTGDGRPVFGMDRMALEQRIGLLAVPDLFWSFSRPPATSETPPAPPLACFGSCAPAPPAVTYARPPARYRLDGRLDLPEVLRRQRRLVALAERQQRFVALLDVPPDLTHPWVARWRAEFASSYAAAYHPWLDVVDPADPQARAIPLPPSAFAAGIIADREVRLGLHWGPANERAPGAVLGRTVTEPELAALFSLAVNVFRADQDGWRLTSARTLSADPDYQQLSVRRLMTALRLTLQRQLQWLVFEPNNPRLRTIVRDVVVHLLRELFRGGAFAGREEREAFFVRCDEALNPPWSQASGRLVAEVGVAPVQPLEFIVVRIVQDTEGLSVVTG